MSANNKIYKNLLLLAGLFLLTHCSPTLYKSGEGQHIPVDEQVSPHPELDSFIQTYKVKLDAEMNTVIGETTEVISKDGSGETALGNLIADYQKEFAEKELGILIDISIMNNGGMRNNLPKGPITLGNIYELSPFDNYLHVLELKEEDVRTLASFAANRKALGISGMTIIAKDGEVIEITVNGKPLLPEKTYLLAVNDYLADGGNGMEFLLKLPRKYKTDFLLREILIDRIKHKTEIGQKITANVEGRQKLD
jgi:2',3'-cyclic-nucleotide 2'-phosphodiesterase (5'-nucleotidase family)